MAALVAMATVHQKNQMTVPMKLPSQFLCNFIFSIYMTVIHDLAEKVMIQNSKGPSCPYMVKTIQTASPEPPGRFGRYFSGRIWGTSFYKIAKIIPVVS